jgi:PadR family transcriptional regulator PadR
MSRDTLGEFEKLVLLAILQRGGDAYGATVIQEIERRTGRTASSGATYVVLRRLEKKGMIASSFGESTPERGGRPKKYYSVRAAGLEALREARRAWDAMAEGLDAVLEQGS